MLAPLLLPGLWDTSPPLLLDLWATPGSDVMLVLVPVLLSARRRMRLASPRLLHLHLTFYVYFDFRSALAAGVGVWRAAAAARRKLWGLRQVAAALGNHNV